MTLTYVMTAEENYPADIAAEWLTDGQPNYCFCDKQYIGTSYDRVRRNIMYSCVLTRQTQDGDGNVFETNSTGQTLWTGLFATPPGATIDLSFQFVFQVAKKNIDTGVVTFYDAYDPAQLVPAGIGGGGIETYTFSSTSIPDDTYTNIKYDNGLVFSTFTVVGGVVTSSSLMTVGGGFSPSDVLTANSLGVGAPTITVDTVTSGSDGSTWGRSVYDSALGGGDVTAITDPRTGNFWVHMQSCELHLFRPGDNFAQAISPLQLPFTIAQNFNADGAPIGVTADWVYFWAYSASLVQSKLMIVPSAITPDETTADCLLATYTYDYPDNTYVFRQCIGPDGNLYVYGGKKSGARDLKLWTAVPGAGFSDITPWNSSTGPNSNIATWTTTSIGWSDFYIIQLPATNQLVCFSEIEPNAQNPIGEFRMDATYYDITGATYDYHEGFVTQYMDANWVSTDLMGAAYLVSGYRTLNNDLDASDYLHDIDYKKRWFMFICSSYAGGSPVGDGNSRCVFVEYEFTYGAAPVVLQVIDEAGWDATYPAYAGVIGQSEVVAGSLPDLAAASGQAYQTDFATMDNGIYDPTTGAFWLSGDNPQFCGFNAAFSGRETQVSNAFNDQTACAASPFMKLNFHSVNPSISPGHYFMERMDNRIWSSVEDTYAVDSGVSNPMTSPAANLYASTAGGAVVFTTDRSVFSSDVVGQVLRMSGGIATIDTFTDDQTISGNWVKNASLSPIGVPYAASGRWTLATPVSVLYAPHLAGASGLVGLADGVPIGPLTVASDQIGTVTLPFEASDVKVGLPFTVQIQTPYLNGQQVIQGARKAIPAATVRVAASGSFQIGTNQPDGSTFSPQEIAPEWTGMVAADIANPTGGQIPPQTYISPGGQTVTTLWTGDLRVDGIGTGGSGDMWNSKGQVAIQQSDPLPLQVLAVMPEYLEGDLPEAEAKERSTANARQPPPQQGGQEAPSGPGPWMLGGGGFRL